MVDPPIKDGILLPEAFKFLAIPDAIAPQLRQVLYGLLLVFYTVVVMGVVWLCNKLRALVEHNAATA